MECHGMPRHAVACLPRHAVATLCPVPGALCPAPVPCVLVSMLCAACGRLALSRCAAHGPAALYAA
eukprot:4457446-Lingulodinium_polyedra.AAC.1